MHYCPLGYTASYWPPARLCSTNYQLLGPAFQTVFNTPVCLLLWPMLQERILCEDLMGCVVKSLTKDNILSSPLIYQASHFLTEIGQGQSSITSPW